MTHNQPFWMSVLNRIKATTAHSDSVRCFLNHVCAGNILRRPYKMYTKTENLTSSKTESLTSTRVDSLKYPARLTVFHNLIRYKLLLWHPCTARCSLWYHRHRIPCPVVTRSYASRPKIIRLSSEDPTSCSEKILCPDVTGSHVLSSQDPMPWRHRIPPPVATRSHLLSPSDSTPCRHKIQCSDVTRSHVLSSKEPPPVALRSYVLSSQDPMLWRHKIPRPVVTRATSCRPQIPRHVALRSHAQLLQDSMSSLHDIDSRSLTLPAFHGTGNWANIGGQSKQEENSR